MISHPSLQLQQSCHFLFYVFINDLKRLTSNPMQIFFARAAMYSKDRQCFGILCMLPQILDIVSKIKQIFTYYCMHTLPSEKRKILGYQSSMNRDTTLLTVLALHTLKPNFTCPQQSVYSSTYMKKPTLISINDVAFYWSAVL